MVLLTMASADTSVQNREIEAPLHKLNFTITGTMPAKAQEIRPSYSEHVAAMIGNATITIQKQDGVSTEILVPALRVADLADMSTAQEGVVYIERNYDAATAANNTVVLEFSVEISDGALYLGDGAKTIIEIQGKPAGTVWTIDVQDNPENTRSYIQYETKYVNANVQKDFSLNGHSHLFVPIADVTAIDLHYSNAKVQRMSRREIRQALRDSSDVVSVINGLTNYGFLDFAGLSVQDCWQVSVTLSSSKNIYLVKRASA